VTTTVLQSLFAYADTTRGVTVRVAVNFMPEHSEISKGRWFWAYHIRIENDGPQAVQLVTRHWEIIDGRGARTVVDGPGVVGQQPVIAAGESYDYVSGCPLGTPNGTMTGSFQMLSEDGLGFDAIIPLFPLSAPVMSR
jgi:ApaG protein